SRRDGAGKRAARALGTRLPTSARGRTPMGQFTSGRSPATDRHATIASSAGPGHRIPPDPGPPPAPTSQRPFPLTREERTVSDVRPMWVAGQPSGGDGAASVHHPYDGGLVARYAIPSPDQVERAVA